MLLTLSLACGVAEPPGENRPMPKIGTPISIAGGDLHHQEVNLEAGEFLRVVVDQLGFDVSLRLVGADGKEILSVDAPTGSDGYEDLLALIKKGGRHQVEVVAPSGEKPAGRYVVTAFEHAPATDGDREILAADRATREGRSQFKLGQFEASIGSYGSALQIFRRQGPRRREIDTLYRLAHGNHRWGRRPEAFAFCDEAIELLRAEEDRRGLDNLLDLAGLIHLDQGQPARALPVFEEAHRLYEQRRFPRGITLALAHMGFAHHMLGQTRPALEAYERALDDPPETEEVTARMGLGHLYLDFHRPKEAFEQYSGAVEIQRRKKLRTLVQGLEGQAVAALRLGQLQTAKASIDEALESVGQNRREPLHLETLGAVLHQLGDSVGARRAFEEAVELARSRSGRSEAVALTRLGRFHVESGEPAVGLPLLRRAEELFEASGDPRGLAGSRARVGQALRDLGRFEEAWENLEPVLDIIDDLRGGTDRPSLRLSAFAFYQEHYEIAVDVLMELHLRHGDRGYGEQALDVHQRRRARELSDSLMVRQTAPNAVVDPTLAAEERRLLRELSEASLLAAGDSQRGARIEELLRGLDKLAGRLRQSLAAAVEVEPTNPTSPQGAVARVGATRVGRALLDPQTLILAFALGEHRSFIWALSAEKTHAFPLPPRRRIESLAARFVDRLARGDGRSVSDAELLGGELSALLLGPVANQLDRFERLVLITEGRLQAVPFSALPGPGGANDDYLVRRHDISVVPSISILASLAQHHSGESEIEGGLIFADAVYRQDDIRLGGKETRLNSNTKSRDERDLRRVADDLRFDPFERIPASAIEAERIRALHPAINFRLAAGFDARREALMATDLSRVAVLHFATHAMVHPELPELSGLVLSLLDAEGRPVNGYIRAFEIARLDLRADLVVLSACQTGLGKSVRGEGMQSLARAFLDAGAARVVYSLWNVSDRHTADLMGRFYDELRTEASAATALRKAQIALLDKAKSMPYQWAGFVFVGDWRAPGFSGAGEGEQGFFQGGQHSTPFNPITQ